MTQEEAENLARADYAKVLGTIIEVDWVYGYVNDDSCEWYFDPPIRVLVTKTDDDTITSTCDEFVDPIYEVESIEPLLKPEHRRDGNSIVDGSRGALPTDARSFWVYGKSYEFEKKKRTSGVVKS
jgi:hypothetical protein